MSSTRNLNPNTSLLLPWSFAGNVGDIVGIKSGILETGLRPGLGVLAMSSASMMFVEAGGRRASLPLHLDGLPTCWIRLPQNLLVNFLCSKPSSSRSTSECSLSIPSDLPSDHCGVDRYFCWCRVWASARNRVWYNRDAFQCLERSRAVL